MGGERESPVQDSTRAREKEQTQQTQFKFSKVFEIVLLLWWLCDVRHESCIPASIQR